MALAAIMPSGHKFVSRSESESTPFESVFFLNSLAVSIKNGTIMITCDLLCLFSSAENWPRAEEDLSYDAFKLELWLQFQVR